MKRLFVFLLSLLCASYSFAQENNGQPTSLCLVPKPGTGFCTFRLCDTCSSLPFDLASIKQDLGLNYGKYYHSATYPGDVTYANENMSCIDTAISGAEACTTDSTGDLYYDVYYPSTYPNYKSCPLPAVIYVHGGGFSDCRKLSKAGNDSNAIAFAERGFVFFNVEYRTGVRIVPNGFPLDPTGNLYATVQQQLAEYRASQDARGAIRTIIFTAANA